MREKDVRRIECVLDTIASVFDVARRMFIRARVRWVVAFLAAVFHLSNSSCRLAYVLVSIPPLGAFPL